MADCSLVAKLVVGIHQHHHHQIDYYSEQEVVVLVEATNNSIASQLNHHSSADCSHIVTDAVDPEHMGLVVVPGYLAVDIDRQRHFQRQQLDWGCLKNI